MLERDPRQLAAWAGAAVILSLLAAWYFARSRPEANAAQPSAAAAIAIRTPAAAGTGTSAGANTGQRVIVDVAGAVKHPGVYRLTSTDRVEDALRRAGGPTTPAD